jgi:AcrR family transcriptional regulator
MGYKRVVAKRGPKPRLSEVQILAVATELVLELGLGGLTMSALARRMNTVVSGLYRYFDSLESVFVALQIRAIAQYEQTLREALIQIDDYLGRASKYTSEQAALIRIVAVFGRYLKMEKSHPADQALVDAFLSAPAAVLQDDFAQSMNQEMEKILRLCASTLDLGVEAGAIDPGDNRQRSHVVWAGLHGLEHFRKRDRIQPRSLKIRQLEQSLMTSLLIGFGARADDVAEALAYQRRRKK